MFLVTKVLNWSFMDSQWDAGRQIGPTAKDQKNHTVYRGLDSQAVHKIDQCYRTGDAAPGRKTARDRIEHLRTYNQRKCIEENLNSEHLVKNNLHVSLHLYSAQSFKKLNFSQHVPFKNSSDLGLEEPTPRFSHSGPSDCLKLQKVRRTTPQSRHTQHPAQIPMLQRTVQYNEELYHMVQHDVIWIEIIQNKRKEKKNICDIKYTLTWDREPVLKHVVWTHSCCDGRPCSLHTEERLGHASLRLRSSSTLFFHTVHLKENNATKHKKRQN